MNDVKRIDKAIKELWKTEIALDYKNLMLLKEDSLKNAFYHHLRNRLSDKFFIDNRIRIFTEFNNGQLQETRKRADIAIVQLKSPDKAGNYEDHLRHHIERIIAIIELKYKVGNGQTIDAIYGDFIKIKDYITSAKIDCQYYLGVIHEEIWQKKNWLDERQINYWAQNKVTELVASYNNDYEMEFEVYAYNNMNDKLNNYCNL